MKSEEQYAAKGWNSKLKIGIFGGTFNPIHLGHCINAQIICEQCGLSQMVFIPSKYPVHKILEDGVSAEDRFSMVQLAVEGNSLFSASRIEIDRNEPSYMVLTLDHLRGEYPNAEFYLVLGVDALNEIGLWRNIADILHDVTIVPVKRPGIQMDENVKKLNPKIKTVDNPLIEISSSDIRRRIKAGSSIKYLVPEKVENYILQKELYRN